MGEEIANSITHGLGWAVAIVELVLLVVFASIEGDAWLIVSCSVFGTGLVLLYASSTMYHALTPVKAKMVFQKLDHSSIFILIAASYTPICLTLLRGPWGWSLLGLVWTGAVLGTVFKSIFKAGRFKVLSLLLYLIMGWAAILAIKPVIENFPIEGIVLLVAGGIAYTLGAAVYAKKGVRYSHSIWHLYVLVGSTFHFLCVFFYVIPKV